MDGVLLPSLNLDIYYWKKLVSVVFCVFCLLWPILAETCDRQFSCELDEHLLDDGIEYSVDQRGESSPSCYGLSSVLLVSGCKDDNFELSSTTVSFMCINGTGSWEEGLFELSCEARSCNRPTVNDTLVVLSPDRTSYAHGTEVTIQCQEEFGLKELTFHTLCLYGKWTIEFDCAPERTTDTIETSPKITTTVLPTVGRTTKQLTNDFDATTPIIITTDDSEIPPNRLLKIIIPIIIIIILICVLVLVWWCYRQRVIKWSPKNDQSTHELNAQRDGCNEFKTSDPEQNQYDNGDCNELNESTKNTDPTVATSNTSLAPIGEIL